MESPDSISFACTTSTSCHWLEVVILVSFHVHLYCVIFYLGLGFYSFFAICPTLRQLALECAQMFWFALECGFSVLLVGCE